MIKFNYGVYKEAVGKKSISELSRKSGIASSCLYRLYKGTYEKYNKSMTLATINRIAEVLEIDAIKLIS